MQPFRLLFSYAYYGKYDLDEIIERDLPVTPVLFADSGAYSAHSVGVEVTVDDYCAWLDRWQSRFVAYANLDVLSDPDLTYANQQQMESAGFAPLPVFHGGEPWEFLDDYCAHHNYVGLGGMVAHGMPAALRWCAQAFQTGQKYGTRFHGFGQTNLRILKSFPWHSVDSSSWGSAHRYGNVTLWDDSRGKFIKVKLGDQAVMLRYRNLIRAHHGDPAVLARPGCGMMRDGFTVQEVRDERAMASAVNMIAWRRLEVWLRAWHAQSVDLYLAATRPRAVGDGMWQAVYLGGKTTPKNLGDSTWQAVYLAEGTWNNFVPAVVGAAGLEASDAS